MTDTLGALMFKVDRGVKRTSLSPAGVAQNIDKRIERVGGINISVIELVGTLADLPKPGLRQRREALTSDQKRCATWIRQSF